MARVTPGYLQLNPYPYPWTWVRVSWVRVTGFNNPGVQTTKYTLDNIIYKKFNTKWNNDTEGRDGPSSLRRNGNNDTKRRGRPSSLRRNGIQEGQGEVANT